jgi:hypothetical protein
MSRSGSVADRRLATMDVHLILADLLQPELNTGEAARSKKGVDSRFYGRWVGHIHMTSTGT